MLRKAIQLANNTLVVSLPASWVHLNNIAKGDQLDVIVRESALLLKKGGFKAEEIRRARVDISGMSASLVWNCVGSVYRSGFNEIEIVFAEQIIKDIKNGESCPTIDLIARVTDKLIGMEIIRQSKNSCILKEITKMKGEEYSNVLNRIYLSLISISDDLMAAFRAKDVDTLVRLHKYSETNVNKLSDYCFRILNIQGLEKFNYSNANYLITFLLEEVGDSYAEVARILSTGKRNSFDPELLNLIGDVHEILNFNYSLFLKYRKDALIEFHGRRNALKKKMDLYAESGKKDTDIIFILRGILDKLMEVNNSQMTMLAFDESTLGKD
jgi:phosphate uptake regulator